MQRTKIEWVRNPDNSQGFSCNPFGGFCPVDCWYCYGKKFIIRFKREREFQFYPGPLHKVLFRKKPSGIFICSTFELFHPITNGEISKGYTYRDQIFDVIKSCPQHRFYILTKLPQNIDRPTPPNVWLGITLEGPQNILLKMHHFYRNLNMTPMVINFISFEPLLREIQFIPIVDWVIVGRLTGHGHKYDPKKEWIEHMIKQAQAMRTPIFLKNNLIPILSEQFVKANQEMPKEQP